MDTGRDAGRRTVAWTKTDPIGAEIADVTLSTEGLHATGTAIGSSPEAYRLDYDLQTDDQYITRRVDVRTTGQGWSRAIQLTYDGSSPWTVATQRSGHVDVPDPGGDPTEFVGALDADLGLSPLFNTMPVLRHRLLEPAPQPAELLMAWISVPDLRVQPSRQRYVPLRPAGTRPALVRFEALGGGGVFCADIEYDAAGFVLNYPGLAVRIP